MTKRLITVVLAVVATLGLAAAPAQAAAGQQVSGTKLVQPLGWEWGI
jgi:P pilus assembly chaperone PapD